ncbi:nuclear transport factor 2 family protein [Humibacter sp.]|uniref:nuclear transport factor 2 family protein n=1 Tax=Humibacter sp. TaxID=1940291 RepID=UPI003F7DDDAA
MDDEDLLQTLLDLERAGWDSLCESRGDAFYGRIMTDDAVMVLANGEVMDRDAVVASLGQAPPWSTYELADVRLMRVGIDGAALVYRGTARREPSGPAFTALMSSVYLRRDGEWRLALYQQTPIPA